MCYIGIGIGIAGDVFFTAAVDNVECVKSIHGIQQSTTGIDTQLTNDMHNILIWEGGTMRKKMKGYKHTNRVTFGFQGRAKYICYVMCLVPI